MLGLILGAYRHEISCASHGGVLVADIIISSTIIGSINEFIDYGLGVVSILIIYYIVKFFMVAPPTKEEKAQKRKEEEERVGKTREWIGHKFKESKEKKEKQRKTELISPVKETLKDALDSCTGVRAHLIQGKRKLAFKQIKVLNDNMDKIWKQLRLLRRKYDGDDARKITEIITEVQAAQEKFLKEVKDKIPKKMTTMADWNATITPILPKIKDVTGELGNAWNKLEQFHR